MMRVRLLLMSFACLTGGGGASAARGDDLLPPAHASAAPPLVEVRYSLNGEPALVAGRILVTAIDGGLLLEERDGRLVTIPAADLLEKSTSGDPFRYFTAEELEARLLEEFGPQFSVVRTRRYVLATNASREYAQWCGKLLERLQTAFYAYWRRDRLELSEPPQPLTAIIFADPAEFAAYAARDAGPAVAATQGYYSIRTNRILLTDLSRDAGGNPARSEGDIQRRLEGRLANLVTVVHEATHQIAFNSGLHTRYADNPMWLTEGMAMYFEAPDLQSSGGWRTAGRVHPGRWQQFQDYVQHRRPPGSLLTLLTSEDRFRDPDAMADAYAESWALTYYLVRERRREYADYLQRLAHKPRLKWDSPQQREEEFRAAFGDDLAALEREFLSYISRLRPALR